MCCSSLSVIAACTRLQKGLIGGSRPIAAPLSVILIAVCHEECARVCINLFSPRSVLCRSITEHRVGIAKLVEHRIHDWRVANLIPGRRDGRFSSPELAFCSVLTLIRCLFHPSVTAVARKSPQSFCPKCRWQGTDKRVCILDPTKPEWADYAVRA